MYKNYIKRIIDFTVAVIGLIFLSPIFIIVMTGLAISNRGNPFFMQERPGKYAKIFRIIKFKTMTNEKDPEGVLLPDSDRLTKIGTFVRKTSLDEIPQLINVLKGDMSLVGPRPLRTHYLPLYSKVQQTRHNVRPGITGWAQVNGRNTISWTKKFELDIYYVNNISWKLDLEIFFLTLKKVIKKEGVSQQGHATVEAFDGSN